MQLRQLFLAAALACACAAATAHDFHAGLTDIGFNARTGSTEVVHTYMAHDVEALLANLYQRQFDLSQPDDQEALRRYLEQQFWLQDRERGRLPLRWVGMTVDAQNVVVYQEAERTPLEKVALVHDAVLSDFLPGQVNTVNVGDPGHVRTLVFDRGTSERQLR